MDIYFHGNIAPAALTPHYVTACVDHVSTGVPAFQVGWISTRKIEELIVSIQPIQKQVILTNTILTSQRQSTDDK